jgi:hypothetical protein
MMMSLYATVQRYLTSPTTVDGRETHGHGRREDLIHVVHRRADELVHSLDRELVNRNLCDEVNAVFGANGEMELTQLMVLDQEIAVELLAVLVGRGHELGFGEHGALAQREPERDDITFLTLQSNQPVEMTSVIGDGLMLNLANEGARVPELGPLVQRLVETDRRVGVTERGATPLATTEALGGQLLDDRRQ